MNNNIKRFIGYLIYVVAFGYLVLKVDDFYRYSQALFSSTYNPPWLWLFISGIFPILVGLLLALPQFIKTFRQKGSWKIDWIVLLTVGLPALCIAITPIIYVAQFALNAKLSFLILQLYPTFVKVAGILFGFVLVISNSRTIKTNNCITQIWFFTAQPCNSSSHAKTDNKDSVVSIADIKGTKLY